MGKPLITPQLIRALVPGHTHPTVTAKKLDMAAQKFGITTPLRVAHFVAQLAHESNLFPREENLQYSLNRLCQVWPNRFSPAAAITQLCAWNPIMLANIVYGGRMGNIFPGDGHFFRGRGMIQLTGRANYRTYGKLVGFDLEKDPDLLLQFGVSALVAAAYWNAHGLNFRADRDDLNGITKAINGGYNGLQHRAKLLAVAKKHLGIK
ncbi:MAG: hypothetical protein Q4C89_06335 [Deinococcus sp.]|uniref:glycoside hydrolase family 19 protein n=1 Tax=Deinococcus sp. TaxID=47478 RepID=UPI0026DC9397|nr:hypothetical protein [Deinococcus sp.]MDO4245621.1 hypothetical protein [Deinococcus sp.]